VSKWISKELFNDFQKEKKSEIENQSTYSGVRRSDIIWETPVKGTQDKPKIYEGRFLPDTNGGFYKKYSYHMFQSGDKWVFIICPKTYNFDNYCPFCSATSKLYQGSAADKKMAYNYKRKEKFVSNFFLVNDPRDAEREVENRVNGKVKLYEFPGKVEMKLKNEVTDTKEGYGYLIFDPGEEGHNFILKVLATKQDQNGNVWPDYSSSSFSRSSEALGTEAEIKRIMEERIDLDEYIKSLEKTDDEIVKALKAEMLWDLVKDEWNRYKNVAVKAVDEEDIDDTQWDDKEEDSDPEEAEAESEDEELDDDELLKELENL